MLSETLIQIAIELWGAVFCLIIASLFLFLEPKASRREYFILALLAEVFFILICDSMAWIFRGRVERAAFWGVRISNYLVFVLNYFIGYTLLIYLEELLKLHGEELLPGIKKATRVVCLLGIFIVTVSQFTGYLYTFDAQNRYVRAEGYLVIAVIAGMMQLLLAVAIFSSRGSLSRVQYAPLRMIILLIFAAYLIQTVHYGVSLVNLSMALGVVIMYFAYEKEWIQSSTEQGTQLLEKNLQLVKQAAELARKDAQMATINAQLTEKRTQIILSQIQPHFLYNTLSAISYLCIKDPKKAKEVTDKFADYLRTNLSNLQNDHLVPFSQELEHTRVYLSIEQVRFGEDLTVEYDIQYSDFLLPSLSVQPVVENAVRHGICGKEEGGKVTIHSRKEGGKILITVTDDGVGFDTNAKPQDGRSHLGLQNVKQRLALLCGGEMIVDSAPGYGTVVTIILPENQE